MQRSSTARHRGHRARVHTVALALVFGLLAVLATGPQGQRVRDASTEVVHAFIASR